MLTGWLNTITVENVHPNTTVAIRMKGIAGKADTFTLYAYDKENKIKKKFLQSYGIFRKKMEHCRINLQRIHYMKCMLWLEDGGEFDLSDTEKEIKIAVILGNK